MNLVKNRYEFVLLFDVKDGNPNGDPDAGNMPRLDAETGFGLVTDVCLKRKVRNYVGFVKNYQVPNDVYIKEKAVLGQAHWEAFKALKISLGEDTKHEIPKDLVEGFKEASLCDGLSVEETDDDKHLLLVSGVLDKKDASKWLKEADASDKIKNFIKDKLEGIKTRKPTIEESNSGRKKMCETFYDIRTFGAVLSLKTAPNCGQVRGPVQFTFGRSIEPIVTLEHSITRMAVATPAEAEKQSGDNRTMGRKHTVPYGLYRSHGFISAPFAAQTGFCEEDLALLWDALLNMFDHDRSAARGEMSTRKLIVFKHANELGSASAHKLFDLVTVKRASDPLKPARAFSDYEVHFNKSAVPSGVEAIEKL